MTIKMTARKNSVLLLPITKIRKLAKKEPNMLNRPIGEMMPKKMPQQLPLMRLKKENPANRHRQSGDFLKTNKDMPFTDVRIVTRRQIYEQEQHSRLTSRSTVQLQQNLSHNDQLASRSTRISSTRDSFTASTSETKEAAIKLKCKLDCQKALTQLKANNMRDNDSLSPSQLLWSARVIPRKSRK